MFKHPAYPDNHTGKSLLILYAFDQKTHRLHHDTALIVCSCGRERQASSAAASYNGAEGALQPCFLKNRNSGNILFVSNIRDFEDYVLSRSFHNPKNNDFEV